MIFIFLQYDNFKADTIAAHFIFLQRTMQPHKDAALHRRCLIPSTGFFEWMHVQVVGKSGKLLKTPEKFPYPKKVIRQKF